MPNLEKIKSISDASQREIFTGEDTMAALRAAMPYVKHLQELADASVEFIVFGSQEDGRVDIKKWPSDFHANVMVATLSKRIVIGTKEDGKPQTKSVCEAVIVHPIPTLDAVLASPAGRDMIEGIWETQSNHKAVSVLRDADNYIAVADQMPVTIEAFATAGRSDTKSKLLEAFNNYANEINGFLRKNSSIWERAKLTKATMRQCLENRARAVYFYGAIEEAQLFEAALAGLIQLASDDGSDTTLFYKWQSTRNDVSFTPDVVTDVAIDADSIVAALTATKSDPKEQEGEAGEAELQTIPADEVGEMPAELIGEAEVEVATEAPTAE